MKPALLLVVLGLAAGGTAGAAAEDPPGKEIVELAPFQVVAQSLELKAYWSNDHGKKMLDYVRVVNVAKGSNAERAGLKVGDRIVAIGGWRFEGHELEELSRRFPATVRNGEATLPLKVRRPFSSKEREVFLPLPQKKPAGKEPARSPPPTPGNR